MFALDRLVEFLITPPGGALLLLIIGLLIRKSRRGLSVFLMYFAVFTLYVGSIPAVSNILMHSFAGRYAPLTEVPQSAEAIVVLGGGQRLDAKEFGGDTLSWQTLERLRYAAFLQRRTGLPLLVSGGKPYGESSSEAALAKDVLERELGVMVTWVEDESTNTYENALNTRRILEAEGMTQVLVVTHVWHMPRAMWSFDQVGMAAMPAPTGFYSQDPSQRGVFALIPQGRAMAATQTALHEWLGMLWYRMKYGSGAKPQPSAGAPQP